MATASNWGKLVNFLAAGRKGSLIPFGYFSPNDNISFLAGPGASTTAIVTQSPAESLNGLRTTFTFTAIPKYIIWNGQFLQPPSDFTVSGFQVTMPIPPSAGDEFYALV